VVGCFTWFAWALTGLALLALIGLAGMLVPGGMTRITAWYLLQLIPPILGLVLLVAVVALAIARRGLDRVLVFQSSVALLALLPALMMVFPLTYPASLKNTQPAATVRLPADEPLKVFWGGDRLAVNQHAITPDQRWAYDLVVEPYLTGSSRLEDYGCYGVTVVAPAEGEVVLAHDGEPDAVPGQLSNNLESPGGNEVVIRLDTGTYLILAHLKPGSVLVQPGQRVAEGQPIGQCGNSGNTSEPHIHIHHQRQDPRDFPVNFAEGLPLYFRDHDGPPMPEGGFEVIDGTPAPNGPTLRHITK